MDTLVKILEEHGLGVAMAVAIGAVCWFLLRNIMGNYKEDRMIWKETLDGQQKLVMNHMTHLQQAQNDVCGSLEQHDKNAERNASEICKAIETQTMVLKAFNEK